MEDNHRQRILKEWSEIDLESMAEEPEEMDTDSPDIGVVIIGNKEE